MVGSVACRNCFVGDLVDYSLEDFGVPGGVCRRYYGSEKLLGLPREIGPSCKSEIGVGFTEPGARGFFRVEVNCYW